MSYDNPISKRDVVKVLENLEDNNAHTLYDLLAYTYSLPGNIPDRVAEKAFLAASGVIHEHLANSLHLRGGE